MLRNSTTRCGIISKSLHWLLFILIAGLLLSGWIAEDMGEELYEMGWILLAVLVTLHIIAALYHHFIRKDEVMRRMTSG